MLLMLGSCCSSNSQWCLHVSSVAPDDDAYNNIFLSGLLREHMISDI
jgi:hypothetical protein